MLMTADEARDLSEQAIKDAQTLNSIMWKIHARTLIGEYYLELDYLPSVLVQSKLEAQGFKFTILPDCPKSTLLISWAKERANSKIFLKIEEGISYGPNGAEFFRMAMRNPNGCYVGFKVLAQRLPDVLYFQARAQIALGIPLYLEAEILGHGDGEELYILDNFKVAQNICLLGL